MRRVDIDPTLENVDTAILDDLIGRGEQLQDFLGILDSIVGNYSIFLDGEWGCGKTFFVKETERLLHVSNENLQSPETTQFKELFTAANGLDLSNSHLPIYFNAWENDYSDSPILPLVETLVSEFSELKGKEVGKESLGRKAAEALKAATVTVKIGPVEVGLDSDKLQEAFENNKPLDELRGMAFLRGKLKDLLDAAKLERANRVVLFVDELDRCRPEYAIKTLEALKFLCDQEYLTTVFSVNARALGLSISSWYGNGFDGPRYLMRFYDSLLELDHHSARAYLSSIGIRCERNEFIVRLAERSEVTMRDLNRCAEDLKRITGSNDYVRCKNETVMRFCLGMMAVGLVIFVGVHPEKRSDIYHGKSSEDLRQWLMEDEDFTDLLIRMPDDWFNGAGSSQEEGSERESDVSGLRLAEERFNEFFDLIFKDKTEGMLRLYGMVQPFQIRRSVRTALGLQV